MPQAGEHARWAQLGVVVAQLITSKNAGVDAPRRTVFNLFQPKGFRIRCKAMHDRAVLEKPQLYTAVRIGNVRTGEWATSGSEPDRDGHLASLTT